jgi:pimeloyl-ACP methyl ester carboxylesterase
VLPLSDLVLNPAHVPALVQRRLSSHVLASMSHGVLRQLDHWMTSGAFTSLDGRVDYRAAIFKLKLPLLFAAGTVDHLAPEAGVVRAHEACTSSDKVLHCFGRAHGHAEDYGHGDLFFGTGAPTEVFPVVQAWLERHATEQGPANGR